MSQSWLDEERIKARGKLEASEEGRRLLAEVLGHLTEENAEAGRSAWQKAFAESQAVLHAQLAGERKKGLVILPLDEAAQTHEALVRAHWPAQEGSPAGLLAMALARHGTFIYVPDGLAVDTVLAPWPASRVADEILSLQVVVVGARAKACVLSGCAQEKRQLGPMRAVSAMVTVGQDATLDWMTLDHFTGGHDYGWRSFRTDPRGKVTWRLVRLADPGATFPVAIRGPLHWEGLIVPRGDGELAVQAAVDLSGEVLVFQNPMARYNVRATGEGRVASRLTEDRARLVRALQAFPMEYALEAEMVLDRLLSHEGRVR